MDSIDKDKTYMVVAPSVLQRRMCHYCMVRVMEIFTTIVMVQETKSKIIFSVNKTQLKQL